MSVLQIAATVTHMLLAAIPLEVSHANATMDLQEMVLDVKVGIFSTIHNFCFWCVSKIISIYHRLYHDIVKLSSSLDINECASNRSNCDIYATCNNTFGSFTYHIESCFCGCIIRQEIFLYFLLQVSKVCDLIHS